MADVKIRNVTFTANSTTGTQDVTLAGFGTVKAVLFFYNRATAANTLADSAQICVGLSDMTASEEHALDGGSQNGVGTTQCYRRWSTTRVIRIPSESGTTVADAEFSASITDGVRINWTTASGNEERITAVFFGGDDLDAYISSIDANAANSSGVSGVGFEPDAVFFACHGDAANSDKTQMVIGWGLAINKPTIENYWACYSGQDGQGNETLWHNVSDDYCTGQQFSAISWGGEVTAFDSDGFDFSTSSGEGGDDFAFLCLKFGGDGFEAGILDTPTSAGNLDITGLGFQPGFLHAIGSTADAVDTIHSDAQANGMSVVSYDGTNTAGILATAEDGAATTNTGCESVTSFKTRSAGTVQCEASASFLATGFRLNFTSFDATARKWIWFAVEANPSTSQSITPAGIGSSEAFGVPTISPSPVTIQPGGIASSESFGSATIVPGVVTVQPAGIASSESFGVPSVALEGTILPQGIPSSEAFGRATFSPINLLNDPRVHFFGDVREAGDIDTTGGNLRWTDRGVKGRHLYAPGKSAFYDAVDDQIETDGSQALYTNVESTSQLQTPDVANGEVGRGFTNTGLAYDPDGNGGAGSYWVGNHGQNQGGGDYHSGLVEMSLAGGLVRELGLHSNAEITGSIQGVTLDTLNGTVWVVHVPDNRVYEVSKTTGDLTGTSINAPGFVNGLAYDRGRDKFWITVSNNIRLMDRAGSISVDVAVGVTNVDQLAYDEDTQILYVTAGGNGQNGKIYAFDTVTEAMIGEVAELEDAHYVEGLAWNGDNDLVVCSDGWFHGTDNNELQIYGGSDLRGKRAEKVYVFWRGNIVSVTPDDAVLALGGDAYDQAGTTLIAGATAGENLGLVNNSTTGTSNRDEPSNDGVSIGTEDFWEVRYDQAAGTLETYQDGVSQDTDTVTPATDIAYTTSLWVSDHSEGDRPANMNLKGLLVLSIGPDDHDLKAADIQVARDALRQADQSISPAGIPSSEAFGSPSIVPVVEPAGIPSSEAFGAPTVSPGTVTVQPAGIASTEAFGVPLVSAGTKTIAPNGIPSSEAFGTPTVTVGPITVQPAGIPSTESFGVPTVSPGAVSVSPGGIASSEAFGQPTIVLVQSIEPNGIPSSESFGQPTISVGNAVIQPAGIASSETFGTPSLIFNQTITPAGITSTEAFGHPTIGGLAPTGGSMLLRRENRLELRS